MRGKKGKNLTDNEIPILLPNLITYGVMKVVTIVITTPIIGKIEEVIASWPALATTKDTSSLAAA
jgi:hypothetical protein